mgnify:CR=1 FL=1
MKPSRLFAFAMIAAGAQAALQTLTRRARWETENKRVQIVVDYDDASAVSIRAGISRAELYEQLRKHGATHVSLPELALTRLSHAGRVVPVVPHTPRTGAPPVGQWMYFASAEAELAETVVRELSARLPFIQAARDPNDACTFSYAGDLETIGEMGLGFESARAEEIHAAGLRVVPRPISYAWADQPLIERTLEQSAALGDGIVAFDGDLILGHEMHLKETVNALAKNNLTYAYFCLSRHQRGDWFIAKSRMPNVLLADAMTPAQMVPEDFHSAAHRWAMLVRERGIRLLYVNFFRVIHATEPLECLHYLEHIVEALEHDGFTVGGEAIALQPLAVPPNETARTGLVSAGVAALALNKALDVPEPFATGITLAGAAVPFALRVLDKPRNELERMYAPSYLPKLLALTTAVSAPFAATVLAAENGLGGFVAAGMVDASSAVTLGALTTGADYQMRVEEYRGYGLDVWLPLLGVALRLRDSRLRTAAVGVGILGWWLTRHRDILGQFDQDHAESHTHHLSTSGRILGDIKLRVGPRPARKWAWLAPVGVAAAKFFNTRPGTGSAIAASGASVLAREWMLVGFRKPERNIELTARTTLPNYAIGTAIAFGFMLLVSVREMFDGE